MGSAARVVPATGLRPRLAARAAVAVGGASRALRLGGGSVIGGRVALLIEPDLLAQLARGRTVALVSGTNGKTTTTRLLTAAMGGPSKVATSLAGSNLPYGLAAALAGSQSTSAAVLEVDEGYLGRVCDEVRPATVTLLNLSRDQLDRVSEVRMVASRWRDALAGRPTVVVANADDPLVCWAAQRAGRTVWVGAGELWHSDSVGCPSCEGRIEYAGSGDWYCGCGFRRPDPDAWMEDDELVLRSGARLSLGLSIPGRFNRANAAMAAITAEVLGVQLPSALRAMGSVSEVEGRFAVVDYRGRSLRLLLAKNPAGWTELLCLLRERGEPVVVAINARVADGHDPSWLWDVPFEEMAGRLVVASGERCADLAVRLRHAGIEHIVVRDQLEALLATRSERGEFVEYVGNYTAFQGLRRALSSGGSRKSVRGQRTAATGPRSPSSLLPRAAPAVVPEVRTPPAGSRGAPGRGRRAGDGVSALRVVVVHPDLLGTYGDAGNGRVLANRAIWHGIPAELYLAFSDVPLPSGADLYCLGGGEDGPQVRSALSLSDGSLERAVSDGAAVLAVCAGFQIIGSSFADADGSPVRGVGLVDATTSKGTARRAVGELVTEPVGDTLFDGHRPRALTGFENHAGVTKLGPGVLPLGRVTTGRGNGSGDGADGVVAGKVIGTYMHGPVLARNPALADRLLELVTGATLGALDDSEEEALRAERLRAARSPRRLRHAR